MRLLGILNFRVQRGQSVLSLFHRGMFVSRTLDEAVLGTFFRLKPHLRGLLKCSVCFGALRLDFCQGSLGLPDVFGRDAVGQFVILGRCIRCVLDGL
ncbi:hypothetical protein ATCV1_z513R [Acanthocystis turfacea chlorella virus 1]|uniref:Uncharacterized protein z513R n=1 Tax=Chlorovirus heliozoae TaxID=322019 RepID=A7K9C3_9PHYC|nr:hypothetical protein ATCV1_z513R [Acanthocystis turfacea chlorella virus 1]ABT16647.1 hypothetical protein ATCV1_z513R [Acanthocystis turfacea chlorella virus 1]